MGKKKKESFKAYVDAKKSEKQAQAKPVTPTQTPVTQTPVTGTATGVVDSMKAYIQKAQQERESAKQQGGGQVNSSKPVTDDKAVDTSTTSNSLNVDWLDKKM